MQYGLWQAGEDISAGLAKQKTKAIKIKAEQYTLRPHIDQVSAERRVKPDYGPPVTLRATLAHTLRFIPMNIITTVLTQVLYRVETSLLRSQNTTQPRLYSDIF